MALQHIGRGGNVMMCVLGAAEGQPATPGFFLQNVFRQPPIHLSGIALGGNVILGGNVVTGILGAAEGQPAAPGFSLQNFIHPRPTIGTAVRIGSM